MIIVDEFPQLSNEWFNARLGNPGASGFAKIVTTKGEPSKSAEDYLYQLAGELVAQSHEIQFSTPWMERGTQLEAEARATYEFITDTEVKQVGLVYYDDRRDRHCSPDGMVVNQFEWRCGLEIKCPQIKTQVRYLLDNKLPTEYIQQVQGSMYITGFDTWDFMSYYPGLAPLIITIERDGKFIGKLHTELEAFCCKLSETVEKLRAL